MVAAYHMPVRSFKRSAPRECNARILYQFGFSLYINLFGKFIHLAIGITKDNVRLLYLVVSSSSHGARISTARAVC